MKSRTLYTAFLLGLASFTYISCISDDFVTSMENQHQQETLLGRPQVEVTFRGSFEEPATKVAFNYATGQLKMHWEGAEELGVYIKKNDGTIEYAGTIIGDSETLNSEKTEQTFKGTAGALENGESYVFVTPAPVGGTTFPTIDWTSQSARLLNQENTGLESLKNYVPYIWIEQTDGLYAIQKQCSVFRLCLTFNENPGKITSIKVKSMDLDGKNDKVFPKAFKYDNLLKENNGQTFADWTSATDAPSEDYTNEITLNIEGDGLCQNNQNQWIAEAYMAVNSSKRLNAFSSKFKVEAIAQNGVYSSEFRSFPGQETVSMDPNNENKLVSLNDATDTSTPVYKLFKIARPMSSEGALTRVNTNYNVFSLLGMWNQYGQLTDPESYIVDSTLWPSQLSDNQSAISNWTIGKSATPTFLSELYTHAGVDEKQSNVTFNNITIVNEPTEVYLTFLSEYAWNQNLLGYYHYDSSDTPSSLSVRKTIVFPDASKSHHPPFNLGAAGNAGLAKNNVSGPENAPVQEFETVQLLYTDPSGYTSKTFPVGSVIGFWMMIDAEANVINETAETNANYRPRTTALMDWNQWKLFTNSAWNAECGNSNWTGNYTRCNFFASGDISNGTAPIPGLAIYGVKDNAINNANTAYGAMIFMVSTQKPGSMKTGNTKSLDISTGTVHTK